MRPRGAARSALAAVALAALAAGCRGPAEQRYTEALAEDGPFLVSGGN